VIAGNGDAIYQRLMRAIGRADLADDPRLAHNDGRAARVEDIDGAISAYTQAHPIETVLFTLAAANVPCGKIYSVADMLADAQFQARDMFETHALGDGTKVQFPGIVPKMSATPGKTEWLGPTLGQHTNEVLQQLGFSLAECDEMRTSGVI
jgi:formyl-CoA transferase